VSPRDRRALLLGGAAIGLALVALRLVPWSVVLIRGRVAALEARAELLERMRADIHSAQELEDSGAVVRRGMVALAPALLVGGTASAASADLGARLAAAAARNRIRVSRTEPVFDSAGSGALRGVGVRVALESDTRGLLQFLDALSRESSVLVLDNLRAEVADPQVPAGQPELLRTELTVRGWYLRVGTSP